MKSKITYNNEESLLTDDFIDIGYSAENFEALNLNNDLIEVKKTAGNRNIQIFISYPLYEEFKDEIIDFDNFMNSAVVDITTYIIFNEQIEIPYKFKKIIPIFDINDEFGEMYGTKIVSGNLENKLTKALFLIGKDGAIYHIDMPEKLENSFDIERIRAELNKAYQTYTGVGCH
jgi:peroxiredoxin